MRGGNDRMKEKAIELCNWYINNLAEAVRRGSFDPEQIARWKESGKLWKYIRSKIEESEGDE